MCINQRTFTNYNCRSASQKIAINEFKRFLIGKSLDSTPSNSVNYSLIDILKGKTLLICTKKSNFVVQKEHDIDDGFNRPFIIKRIHTHTKYRIELQYTLKTTSVAIPTSSCMFIALSFLNHHSL